MDNNKPERRIRKRNTKTQQTTLFKSKGITMVQKTASPYRNTQRIRCIQEQQENTHQNSTNSIPRNTNNAKDYSTRI